jgi:hypothetical protein
MNGGTKAKRNSERWLPNPPSVTSKLIASASASSAIVSSSSAAARARSRLAKARLLMRSGFRQDIDAAVGSFRQDRAAVRKGEQGVEPGCGQDLRPEARKRHRHFVSGEEARGPGVAGVGLVRYLVDRTRNRRQKLRRRRQREAGAHPARPLRQAPGLPFGQHDQHRPAAMSLDQAGDFVGLRIMRRRQDEEMAFAFGRRVFTAAKRYAGIGAVEQVDDAGIARRALRQRMASTVVAARQLRSERDQRPERDEGDHADDDDAGDHQRVEAAGIGGGLAHPRAQFCGTVSSA